MLCQEQTDNVKRKPMAQARKPRADGARNRQLLIDAAKSAVGVSYGNPDAGWEASARRLIDILMDGLRHKAMMAVVIC